MLSFFKSKIGAGILFLLGMMGMFIKVLLGERKMLKRDLVIEKKSSEIDRKVTEAVVRGTARKEKRIDEARKNDKRDGFSDDPWGGV